MELLQQNDTDGLIYRRPRLRNRTNDLNFATWNVRTLYKPGALEELKEEATRYKLDLIALQELRWPSAGFIEQRTHSLFHTASKGGHFGTGFLVYKSLRDKVIDFQPISETICMLRLKGKYYNVSIVNAHAPTEDKEENVKTTFYNKLERVIEKLPRYDMKIILGDFNAKIGKESYYQPTIGKHSLHDVSNDNAIRLIELAATVNCKISSTYFPHKSIHKHTWKSPDGNTCNQIDHVLISSRHVKNVQDIKSCRGANIDSDHYLVKFRLKYRIARQQAKAERRTTKWNCTDLKDPDTLTSYQDKLDEFIHLTNNSSIEDLWSDIKTSINSAAESTLNKDRPQKNQWFDDECKNAIDKKNIARNKLLQRSTRASTQEYITARNLAYRTCRKKKRDFMKRKVEDLEIAQQKKDLKTFYAGVQAVKSNVARQRATLVRDKDGHLTSSGSVSKTWADHFERLLNPPPLNDAQEDTPVQNPTSIEQPSLDEIEDALLKLKNHKAPGYDNLPAELLKAGSNTLKEQLHQLICRVWETEEMPEDWKTITLIPVFKKGDPTICTNYRGISLLCIAYKVLANILYKRLTPYTENVIGEYQCGFRKNRSTTDHIFTLKQILEKNWEHGRKTYYLFIDFKTAYDSISREKVWEYMGELNFPSKLINLAKMTTNDMKYLVRVGSKLSEKFVTSAGLKQGDAIAPMLFNIVLETILRKAHINTKKNIIRNSSQLLAYADDIAILARDPTDLTEMFSNIDRAAREAGLKINEAKTKVMIADRRGPIVTAPMNIQQYTFEVVSEFTYLGCNINPNNNTTAEISRRILMGRRCIAALNNLLKSRLLSRSTKLKLYKTLILPVVTYGAEAWTISRVDEEKLLIFERQILRKIYGPVKEGEAWRIRMNHELQQLYDSPNIIGVVKARRLDWFGHLQRMPQDRMALQVFQKTPIEKRPPGRPKLRWLDNIQNDLKTLKISNWKTLVQDRRSWKHVVVEAKTLLGL